MSGPKYSERSHSAHRRLPEGDSWGSLQSRAAVDERAFWEEWTADGKKGACNWSYLGVVSKGVWEVPGHLGHQESGEDMLKEVLHVRQRALPSVL